MPSIAVIGGQWGDEGKAKVVDLLAQSANAVVRTSGGNNAGHTVTVNGTKYRFSSVPCGILHKDCICIIGNGTAINPQELLAEIEDLKAQGLPVENIRVSNRAHVVMPYHIILDGLMDEVKEEGGKVDPASARHGIRPCYMDKYLKEGIRVCDMMDRELFAKKVRANVATKNRMITRVYGGFQTVNADDIIEEYTAYAEKLAPYVAETGYLLAQMIDLDNYVVFEGAQATMLDPDFGTYPYVTTSHPTIGGVLTGSGVGPHYISHVMGVMKAYTTRAGKGPFPTQLFGPEAHALRENGHEYETNGASRRVGWFDCVVAHYAARINGMDSIALTKMNSLNYLDEVKICTGYEVNGTLLKTFPSEAEDLDNVQPVYEVLPGWGSLDGCNTFDDLPENAKRFIARLEEQIGAPVSVLELGRGKMIARGPLDGWVQE